ncbi:MAG: CHAT domain-containing protein [Pseudanabaenaceae cyanobacterium bins.68]|nr:CHAT domain-containing protein [Pseudanabaenaceae cyanobacterium bins.68]
MATKAWLLALALGFSNAAHGQDLTAQIQQALAWQKSGFYGRANQSLLAVGRSLQNQPDDQIKLNALLALGNSLRLNGDFEQATAIYGQAKLVAENLGSVVGKGQVLLGLGNLAREKPAIAAQFYLQAAELNYPPTTDLSWRAQLEYLSLLPELDTPAMPIASLAHQILEQLERQPQEQALYGRVYLAESLIKLKHLDLAEQILGASFNSSGFKLDQRAQVYALITYGHSQELRQQWSEAIATTNQALAIAQRLDAQDQIYQAQAQLGRIYLATQQQRLAIAAFSEAYQSLRSLRRDLVALPTNAQFSFSQTVEPIYRQYLDLLLQEPQPSQANLSQAIEVVAALQLAELENFLRQACLDLQPQAVSQVDPRAAVIYPIVLPQRLVVITAIPNHPLLFQTFAIASPQLDQFALNMLNSLRLDAFPQERLPLAQQLYDWLIRPNLNQLAEVQTLVFVLDGSLRNLPIAASHDGRRYLIEQFNVVLNSSLKVGSKTPKLTDPILFAGVSQSNSGFSPLPGVEQELSQISKTANVQSLLNQSFTWANLANQLRQQNFPVLHLATHGQFSSKPEDTFLLAWNEKIDSNRLELLLQAALNQRIELLILSACETAVGDPRAVLGLAGLAIKSGANSTIATLWAVQDQSAAQFMAQLYGNLFTKSKAAALRQAQLALLQDPSTRHPYYWAAYILVGSWQ